jgi:hypothetical protein
LKKEISIFWFRRDLRLDDNKGLFNALNENDDVLPIFIFDTDITNKLNKNDHRLNYINKVINDKARQVITAGGKGEQVIEKSEWGHSAFTLNLKRGLKDGKADYNSDGYITANELGMFLTDKVSFDSGNQQTPQ